MAGCELLQSCAFFKEYEKDDSRKLALGGMIRLYCQGENQSACVRKKVRQKLGPEQIPVNMMPNGAPLTGTSDSDWPEQVKAQAWAKA